MIQGKCRIWNLCISALAFLSLYNIIITLKLLYAPECLRHSPPLPKPTVKIIRRPCEKDEKAIYTKQVMNLNLQLGRWDMRLQYKLFDHIVTGEKFAILSELFRTCLATQSSIEKIASIIEVSNHWNGPISLAIFAASEDELNTLLLYVMYLRKCDARIRDKVSFHLAIPKDKRPKKVAIDIEKLDEMDCGNPMGTLQSLIKKLQKQNGMWRMKMPYPQNLMRNLARKNCQSKFVFLTDVDIIPNKGMAESLDVFLINAKCKGLCAYVIPTYEIDERVRFPPNKTELIRLANRGLARPFHHKVFIYNQYATNFSRWQNATNERDEVHINHPVTNFEFLYEPFYVAPDTVPLHDERFVGYGYTRNSQVYEMYVAGYEFLVLSPIFTCHWGLQIKRTRPPWREHQNNLNRKNFDGFKTGNLC
ncbi:unnamed protein product [Brassicogethes aeneus]|uniref:Beta-1,4-glucuronyltransferase 1 n=1 Tax=Brassicogethes aeneus TaxID=1431903 RepID=A0A9P0B1G2_BRAAE|nr:unnamed protein product [Brassicogethes aeneus]